MGVLKTGILMAAMTALFMGAGYLLAGQSGIVLAFVVAAAQVGLHDDGRKTWGHSMIVDPWGKVMVDMGGSEPGLAVVDLDLDQVTRTRDQIPSLRNERDYTLRHVTASGT